MDRASKFWVDMSNGAGMLIVSGRDDLVALIFWFLSSNWCLGTGYWMSRGFHSFAEDRMTCGQLSSS
jgi:hypothetical protein